MSIILFIEEPKTIDRIIRHLEISFLAERAPPRVLQQELFCGSRGEGGAVELIVLDMIILFKPFLAIGEIWRKKIVE